MNEQEAVNFGDSSACMAIDQRQEYACLQDAVDCYRENVRETLKELGGVEFEREAFAAFDAVINAFRAAQ